MADAGGAILHMKQARIPEIRLEWHPGKKIVYAIQAEQTIQEAVAFAWNIECSGDAWNAALIWCRGYIAHRYNFAKLIDEREKEITDEHAV